MINVTLVGTGNLSSHLQTVFEKAENINSIEVISSREKQLKKALSVEKKLLQHIYIIAVSDDTITSVSKEFIKSKSLIVHTSGSVSMSALPKEVRQGVFYPVQTFSKGSNIDFKTIPICIEAEANEDLELLRKLAGTISESVFEISSAQRKILHLAAVFVNNFTNHLYQIGHEICEENQIPFDILKPLILETAVKINKLEPSNAQTGPARRNDSKTIERHLDQLENKTHRQLYQILTKSIKEHYGEKL